MRGAPVKGPRDASPEGLDKPTMSAVLQHYGVDYRDSTLGWQSTLCPVHSEDTASFRVSTEDGGFLCQACGIQGGDVLDLIMIKEECDFPAAKRIAAGIPGERSGKRVTSGRPPPVARRESGYRPSFGRKRRG